MSERVLAVCYASGSYVNYIPMYSLFLSKAYPEWDLKVYVSATDWVKTQRDCYPIAAPNNHQARPIDIGERKDLFVERGMKLFPPLEDLQGYDYIYTGDIDMFLCRETPSLLEQRKAHMQELGVPVSYKLRAHHQAPLYEITSYHMLDGYLAGNCEYQRKYTYWRNLWMSGEFKTAYPEYINAGIPEEYMLYLMYRDMELLPAEEHPIWQQPDKRSFWHGVHMGPFRKEYRGHWNADQMAHWVNNFEGANLSGAGNRECWEFWKRIMQKPEYHQIIKRWTPDQQAQINWMREEYEKVYG